MHGVTLYGICADAFRFRCTALQTTYTFFYCLFAVRVVVWGRLRPIARTLHTPPSPPPPPNHTYRKYEIIFSCHVTFSVVVFSNFVTSCEARHRKRVQRDQTVMVSPLFMSTLLSTAVAMTLTTLCIFFPLPRAANSVPVCFFLGCSRSGLQQSSPFGEPQYVWNDVEPGCRMRMKAYLLCITINSCKRKYLFSGSAKPCKR